MKNIYPYLFLMIVLPVCWGCSNSSGTSDSSESFSEVRVLAADLRQISYDALVQATKEKYALSEDSPRKTAYVVSLEDLLLISTYDWLVLNQVIQFQAESQAGEVYAGSNGGSTLSLAGGVYTFSYQGEAFLNQGAENERIRMDFNYDTTQDRWLILGYRGGGGNDSPVELWFKQEGEIVGATDYYLATTIFFMEEGIVHSVNTRVVYDEMNVTLQMACERTDCTTDCVDVEPALLYSQGLSATGLEVWDAFKIYTFVDAEPDYEIP